MKVKTHPKRDEHNNEQQKKSNQERITVLKWLAKHYPAAFDTTKKISALKHGIFDDLVIELDSLASWPFSKTKLRQTLAMFMGRMDYQACLKSGGVRINLQGDAVGEVSELEATSAANKIKVKIDATSRAKAKALRASNQSIRPVSQDGRVGAPQVMVKRKVSRPPIDQEAVARLKAKLGLKKTEKA